MLLCHELSILFSIITRQFTRVEIRRVPAYCNCVLPTDSSAVICHSLSLNPTDKRLAGAFTCVQPRRKPVVSQIMVSARCGTNRNWDSNINYWLLVAGFTEVKQATSNQQSLYKNFSSIHQATLGLNGIDI